jgi:phosphohistidine phosphatase SixA
METTTLTFLRHATAQDRALRLPDASRTLVDKGKKQMQRVADFCRQHKLTPAYLLCSPLVRAQETAQTLQKNLPGCPNPKVVSWLADTEPDTMQAELEKLANSGLNDFWLVGHEPDFSSLISQLLGQRETIVEVKKASLIRLEVDFRTGAGELLWSIPNTLMK